MRVGDVLRLRNVRHYFSSTLGEWVEYKPIEKKEVGVYLFLGNEPIDGSKPLDCNAAMRSLGWESKK